MALTLDEDQSLIQDTAREFCTTRAPVAQLRALRDRQDPLGWDADTWRAMVELGWAGIAVPEAHGGTGFGWQALGAILTETGRQLTASPLLATVVVGTAALLRGSGTQQASLLFLIAAAATEIYTAGNTLPLHDALAVATTARRDGDAFVVDGRKTFVLDGHVADVLLVVARTSGAPGDRDGLTLLLVPGDAAGVTRVRTHLADSRNAANLTLGGVRVPADAVLGTVDDGAAVLEPVLDHARIALAAEMLGTAEEAFARTVSYLQERRQFGVVIGSFQGLKHRAADLHAELQLARSVVLDALSALDEGRDDVAQLASLAKAKVGEVLHAVSNEAIQMHGGIGMTDEFDIGFYLKRARVAEAAFGAVRFHRDRYAALSGY